MVNAGKQMKFFIYPDFVMFYSRKSRPVSSPAKSESFLSHLSSEEHGRDILKHGSLISIPTSPNLALHQPQSPFIIHPSSSTSNSSTSSPIAQSNGSIANAPNVIPLPSTSSSQSHVTEREGGEAITKSVVDSSVVYPISEIKDEVSSFTDMLRVPPQVNQASQKEDKENEGKGEEKGEVKTVKGKRGVNDSDKKSFRLGAIVVAVIQSATARSRFE
ncbi:hypothetical protein BYT27DRAFT_7262052 [Phlegmacium glaucopus]|nr:hypothetical protein BYT27DRAFT_7262052 [Phlegmacium glaucopus]